MQSPLVDWLYSYALNNRLDGHFTDGEEEYLSCLRYSELHLERLTALLDEHARAELDDYVRERDIVDSYHREALFFAGLSIGLQLSRLG